MNKRSFATKGALLLAEAAGKTGAFYVLVIWMFGWMVLATAGIWYFKRDPYPFVFLLFLSNLVQLFYLPLLQIKAVQDSQRREQQHREHLEKLNAIHKSVEQGNTI